MSAVLGRRVIHCLPTINHDLLAILGHQQILPQAGQLLIGKAFELPILLAGTRREYFDD